jgi:DNA-3-methyladenine glycosylase I
VPERDDRALFEKLVLDGFQAGLSWLIILRKRDSFRAAFHGFDPVRIARYNARSVERLLADPGIVRNRQKVEATIGNARAYLRLREEEGASPTSSGGSPVGGRGRMRGATWARSPPGPPSRRP